MTRDKLLQEIKSSLHAVYGNRLKGVVLYGSEVRGEVTSDSDIDVLVLLEGPVHQWQEIHACTQALYPLILETERIIDAVPVDIRNYEAANAPLYIDAREKGILV